MVRWEVAPVLLVLFSFRCEATCPPPGYSKCNCSDVVGKVPLEVVVSCDGLGTVPDLRYELEGIPMEEVTELAILRTKDFKGLRPDFFKDFKRLKRLGLAANPGSGLHLPVGIFDSIGKNLQALDLSTSNQTEKDLSPELFAPLVNLKDLDLSNNQIVQVRPTLFAPLKNLQTLDLGDNKLTKLPPFVFAENRLLKMLDLNDNQLAELPLDLFDDAQPNLKILDIGGNRISSLTSAHLMLFPGLTVLDARKNQIAPLNSDLFSKTPQLARICLDGLQAAACEISGRRGEPSHFFRLRALPPWDGLVNGRTSLSVYNQDDLSLRLPHELMVIPPHIFDKIPLESLDLSDCPNIRTFPEGLFSKVGQTLKELHLDDNPKIYNVPYTFFEGMDKLEILDMSNTGIDYLPKPFWEQLPSLRKLKISDNSWLMSLPPPKSYSLQLKFVDATNCPKLPLGVTKWIKQNFETKSLLLDFPINIFRSINREIQLQHITKPPATTPRTTRALRPGVMPAGNGGGNGGGGGRWNNNNNNNNNGNGGGNGRWNNNNGGGNGNNNNNYGGNGNEGRGNDINYDDFESMKDNTNDNNNNNQNNNNNNNNNGGGGGGWGWGWG